MIYIRSVIAALLVAVVAYWAIGIIGIRINSKDEREHVFDPEYYTNEKQGLENKYSEPKEMVNIIPLFELNADPTTASLPANSAADYIAGLQELSATLDGDELVEAQIEFIRSAFENLVFMEAAKFLEFVFEYCGEAVHLRISTSGLAAVARTAFSWPDRFAVVEWAIGVESPELRRDALMRAGSGLLYDEQIEVYLPRLTPEDARNLLRVYSVYRVSREGVAGIEAYIRMLPKGADMSDLTLIVRALDNESDFLKADQLIPDDDRHIAREARSSLLQRWARDDPQAAAAHVIANRDRIDLDQLDPIVWRWAMREPQEAVEWIRSQTDEAVRSQAAHGMASHLVQRQAPDRAWEWALEIVDPDMRARTLREVHAAWITQDFDAAENARLSLDE